MLYGLGVSYSGYSRARRAEQLEPLPPPLQVKRVVDRVTRLVAQDLHAPLVLAALDFEHLALFELLEPRMREIERNGDAADAVGREPFVGEPVVRMEHDLALREFLVEERDARRELAALDGERQIAHPDVEQLFVGQRPPVGGRRDVVLAARAAGGLGGRRRVCRRDRGVRCDHPRTGRRAVRSVGGNARVRVHGALGHDAVSVSETARIRACGHLMTRRRSGAWSGGDQAVIGQRRRDSDFIIAVCSPMLGRWDVPRQPAMRYVESAGAEERLEAARAFLASFAAATELLVIGASREAADDLCRDLTRTRGTTFGLHRFTLGQYASRVAGPSLAEQGLALCTPLGAEAVAARAAFEAKRRGALSYLEPVVGCPGLPRALASTLNELAPGAGPIVRACAGCRCRGRISRRSSTNTNASSKAPRPPIARRSC